MHLRSLKEEFTYNNRDCKVELIWSHIQETITVTMNNIVVLDQSRLPLYICKPGRAALVAEGKAAIARFLHGNNNG